MYLASYMGDHNGQEGLGLGEGALFSTMSLIPGVKHFVSRSRALTLNTACLIPSS